MREPEHLDISWRKVIQINIRFAYGALSSIIGWFAWNKATPDWWGLWILGAFLLLGGVMELMRAAFEAYRMILDRSRLRRFERKGRVQKADPLASDQDMVDAGKQR